MSDLTTTLLPHHLADLRDGSGLAPATIEELGFWSERDPAVVARHLGWDYPADKLGPCLMIPFPGAEGYVRAKPDKPLPYTDGNGKVKLDEHGKPKVRKYESPKGRPNRVYIPPAVRPVLCDPSVELFITEGEKKAAKATQEGFPCLGLVGIYGWVVKDSDPKALIDDLAQIVWPGRRVCLVFDSDAVRKPEVLRAEYDLCETLKRHQAKVVAVRLPDGRPT